MPAFETLRPERAQAVLTALIAALHSIMNSSFFITMDMTSQLHQGDFYGVLPVLYFFLARSDNEITELRYLHINETGGLETVDEKDVNKIRTAGVQITFRHKGSAKTQELFYFRTDLADKALKADPRFLKYLTTLGPVNSYLKAASYLMHANDFSIIRDLLVTQSASVLEDDSGIPYRFFNTKQFQISLYGNYIKPIRDFPWGFQADLKKAYAMPNATKPLPFKTGYGRVEATNLLFAKKIPVSQTIESKTADVKPTDIKAPQVKDTETKDGPKMDPGLKATEKAPGEIQHQ